MTSTSHILAEIASATSFLGARGGDGDGDTEKIQSNFAKAVTQQINFCLSLPTADATLVMEALDGDPSGKYTADVKAAIDKKVGTATSAEPAGQKLKHWWNYLISADWETLLSGRAATTPDSISPAAAASCRDVRRPVSTRSERAMLRALRDMCEECLRA